MRSWGYDIMDLLGVTLGGHPTKGNESFASQLLALFL